MAPNPALIRTHSGKGMIHVSTMPVSRSVLSQFEFHYPLKLISSSVPSATFQTVFILSYGGGLVAGDIVELEVKLDKGAKLCLLTQGSTKVFKCLPRKDGTIPLTRQFMNVHFSDSSSLLLLPDPVQPHAKSNYFQKQTFNLPENNTASVLILDWCTEGRSAMDEHWNLTQFETRNILREGKEVLIRDMTILEGDSEDDYFKGGSLRTRMEDVTAFATLLIRGPLFEPLRNYAQELFATEPRIGQRRARQENEEETRRRKRSEDVTYTVAEVRGVLIVRAQSKNLEKLKVWLRRLIVEEGREESCVIKGFGQSSLFTLT